MILLLTAAFAASPASLAPVAAERHVPMMDNLLPGTVTLYRPGFYPTYVTDGTTKVAFELHHSVTPSDLSFVIAGALPADRPFGFGFLAGERVQDVPVYLDGVRLMRPGGMD